MNFLATTSTSRKKERNRQMSELNTICRSTSENEEWVLHCVEKKTLFAPNPLTRQLTISPIHSPRSRKVTFWKTKRTERPSNDVTSNSTS